MSTPLRVLIVTDSFPPRCGGSGWSTFELSRGLMARGHHVEVIKIEPGSASGLEERTYESIRVTAFRINAPGTPFLRNMVKNERLWSQLTDHLVDERLRTQPVDIIHAQHVMSTVPAVRAGQATGIPVVATVRDYWPVCYWSDLIYDPSQPKLCPACTPMMMTRCLRPRAGAATPAAWPLVPYMRSNLRTKRRTLAQANAVIAVSTTIADDLRARAPELSGTSLYTIPNPVDMMALDRAHAQARRTLDGPYVLYAGKLATNKGVQYLLPALDEAQIDLPLVIVGEGPLAATLAAEARTRGRALTMLGWQDRDAVWALMRHAHLLAFPSYGPESLSRVLIEASALGVPIAAMNTGGTRDILQHQVTGLLSDDAAGFARDLAALASDDRLRAALGAAARTHAHTHFAAPSVVARVEHVYRQLLVPQAA